MIVNCDFCGTQNDISNLHCINCGANLADNTEKIRMQQMLEQEMQDKEEIEKRNQMAMRRFLKTIIIIFFVIPFIGTSLIIFLIGLEINAQNKNSQPGAILSRVFPIAAIIIAIIIIIIKFRKRKNNEGKL